jgi:hypothetical protein
MHFWCHPTSRCPWHLYTNPSMCMIIVQQASHLTTMRQPNRELGGRSLKLESHFLLSLWCFDIIAYLNYWNCPSMAEADLVTDNGGHWHAILLELHFVLAKNWKNCILSWQKIGGSLHKAPVALSLLFNYDLKHEYNYKVFCLCICCSMTLGLSQKCLGTYCICILRQGAQKPPNLTLMCQDCPNGVILRRRSGARGDRDMSYLVLEELASLSVYLLLHLCR